MAPKSLGLDLGCSSRGYTGAFRCKPAIGGKHDRPWGPERGLRQNSLHVVCQHLAQVRQPRLYRTMERVTAVRALYASDEPIKIGVSSCLLGEQVRFDGGHKRSDFLVDTLGRFVEFVPVCPEMEIGLGVPRETLRLVRSGDAAFQEISPKKSGSLAGWAALSVGRACRRRTRNATNRKGRSLQGSAL
jgi:hypothetical protein